MVSAVTAESSLEEAELYDAMAERIRILIQVRIDECQPGAQHRLREVLDAAEVEEDRPSLVVVEVVTRVWIAVEDAVAHDGSGTRTDTAPLRSAPGSLRRCPRPLSKRRPSTNSEVRTCAVE